MARRRALCRHPRPPPRQRAPHVGLPRLGREGLQRQPPLRPIHDSPTRRRSSPRRHPRAADGDRLLALQRDNKRGGIDQRRAPLPLRRRPHSDDAQRLDGAHRAVRRLPRSQVRPDLGQGFLFALRLLQLGGRPRLRWQHRADGTGHQAPHPRSGDGTGCARREAAGARKADRRGGRAGRLRRPGHGRSEAGGGDERDGLAR